MISETTVLMIVSVTQRGESKTPGEVGIRKGRMNAYTTKLVLAQRDAKLMDNQTHS